jgi:hypothetical protein
VHESRLSRSFAALLFAVLSAGWTPAFGEMCAGDYQTGSRRLSKAQRAQEQSRVDAERERSERLEAEQLAMEQAARRAEEERLAARPAGVKLVEARCGTCHAPEFIQGHTDSYLGWWLIAMRMELLNGARLQAGERHVIVAHLATTQPSGALRSAVQWSALAMIPAGLIASTFLVIRRYRRSSSRRVS